MQDEKLRDALFSERLWQRLQSVAQCDPALVINDFDAVPAEVLSAVDILLTGWHAPRIDEGALSKMPRLSLIAHAGGSVKGHVDRACWERGVVVTTAAIANAIPVAEFALAQATDLYRRRQAAIDREAEFPGTGNYEKVVGLVGASTIGRLVLERLEPFDLEVILYDPTLSESAARDLGARKVDLEELLTTSDVVSLHAPVLPETVGMIGVEQLGAMRDGTTLINTARGALINHDALRNEVRAGRIFAVLDVTTPEPLPPEDPLYTLPNVQLTPHIAGSMGTELRRMTAFALTEIELFAAGRTPKYPVEITDLPTMA
jgi:phosphoglycerate dehydrogenase-like enzyme